MQGGLNLYLKEHFYAPLVSQCDYLFEKCLQQLQVKLENILKGSLDSFPSPSTSMKIQIFDGKYCLRCKGKTLLGFVDKLLKTMFFLITKFSSQ